MMFIDFNEFIKNTDGVVREVCSFVGADPALYNHKVQPAGMQVMHTPSHYCARPFYCTRSRHCSRHFHLHMYKP